MQSSKNYSIFAQQTYNTNHLPQITKEYVIPLLKTYSIVALTGPLGAGKTTLVQEILKQLGLQEPITSPTFGYLKRYTLANNIIINHFDLYRIDSIESFVASGFDEYLHQKNTLTFIEWPSIIAQLLIKQKTLFITLAFDPKDLSTRTITIAG